MNVRGRFAQLRRGEHVRDGEELQWNMTARTRRTFPPPQPRTARHCDRAPAIPGRNDEKGNAFPSTLSEGWRVSTRCFTRGSVRGPGEPLQAGPRLRFRFGCGAKYEVYGGAEKPPSPSSPRRRVPPSPRPPRRARPGGQRCSTLPRLQDRVQTFVSSIVGVVVVVSVFVDLSRGCSREGGAGGDGDGRKDVGRGGGGGGAGVSAGAMRCEDGGGIRKLHGGIFLAIRACAGGYERVGGSGGRVSRRAHQARVGLPAQELHFLQCVEWEPRSVPVSLRQIVLHAQLRQPEWSCAALPPRVLPDHSLREGLELGSVRRPGSGFGVRLTNGKFS